MKAIRFNQYGEPAQVLAVQEHPVPESGNEEVRVRILASPINPCAGYLVHPFSETDEFFGRMYQVG